MTTSKRPLEEHDATELKSVHISRKKRLKYTEQDAQLADIYNNLADEVQAVRIKAAGDLLNKLSTKSSANIQQLETAESRLIRGLCSGRKVARLGFSIALAEIFRLKFNDKLSIKADDATLVVTVDKVVRLTTPEGNVSGQERRDHYLGRRFAFQALLQSDAGLSKRLPDNQWQHLIQSIFELASQKQWLRRECISMVCDYLSSDATRELSELRIRTIIDELIVAKLAKTPEGVAMWIAVQQRSPQVKLPKGLWHHKDPLSSRELPSLSKILLEIPSDDEVSRKNSGSRQSTPSFAWTVILARLYEREDPEAFAKFWETAVAMAMFSPSSSAERKALGLQVLSLAISTAPASVLPDVLASRNIVNCLIDQRANPERYLFDAAKIPLNQIITRVKQEPEVATTFVTSLIENGTSNFDQLTKSKTLDSVISGASESALEQIINVVSKRMEVPPYADRNGAENERRVLADLLLNAIKAHRQSGKPFHEDSARTGTYSLVPWATQLLASLVILGYKKKDSLMKPEISEMSQSMFRLRLMSCIGCLLDNTIEKAVVAPLVIVDALYATAPLQKELSRAQRSAVESAINIVKRTRKQEYREIAGPVMHALQLLFSLSIIQVYNDEADSQAALEDLISCYRAMGTTDDSSTALIELLLSFISKPSITFKKVAEQVFAVFAAELRADGLQSLVDILGQKESLSGQQALFEQRAEGEQDASGSDMDVDIAIDVEDASDVELTNARPESPPEEESNEDNSASTESPFEAGEDSNHDPGDEVAAFDKKLADALGTSALEDTDDDGSDMDDEQMMALEPTLTTIFKERQKDTSKKSDRKDAKENIVNFKNRVLDLLMIYVKSQYANVLALDLVLPLTITVRTTTNKPTSEKAFAVLKHYYEACNKNKVSPQPEDYEACFEVLSHVHEEMKLGGSKMHANACSRASLFLSKVLIALDLKHYERIADMYAKMQSEWYLDGTSKVPSSVFTEWTSWSISTRKHM